MIKTRRRRGIIWRPKRWSLQVVFTNASGGDCRPIRFYLVPEASTQSLSALLTCVREANLGRATASTRILGATNTRPRSDTVAGRLDVFRERLKQRFSFFEGLAFA